MQIKKLFPYFDKLQKECGCKDLNSIYGAGKIKNPKIVFVFMNPTGKNIASNKNWNGIKAPWLGTKNVWKLFYKLKYLNKELFDKIQEKKAIDWDVTFAEKVYRDICKNSIYITNLSKATQLDARPLKNHIFMKYLDLFKEEIDILQPKIIITFGNQVSSIILNKNINVSKYRKKFELLKINDQKIKVFPVYYPVGQGLRNIDIAKEDINWIIKNHL